MFIIQSDVNEVLSYVNTKDTVFYLGKFIPIRKINSIGHYDITFDRLKVGGKLYEGM